ncbi:hypothetical protein HCN51_26875 [Nonomuraea sp. FMUSA5-5]|uniref:FtsX-like permease family protein n=1 Tax=Nonomuraea composti TaxID=2720023 RepID=A0ABX1BDU9_9ACTN|nr:hypothetical protein [Nonomuraea sp. FMUSA5-5]NJP93028.1 hypothetical protein [Nonomuraea sp. FMUSA5-5]
MPFDLASLGFGILFAALFAGLPLATAATAVPAAVLSAPAGRHDLVRRGVVVVGLFTSFCGALIMGLGAWLARADTRYGALESLGFLLLSLLGAGLLMGGLGPLPSWLLELAARAAERLPLPFRLAARDLAHRRIPAVAAITLAMLASAAGIAVTVIATGETTQDRAAYQPQARPGALVVRPGFPLTEGFSAAEAGAVRAAIERELPGVPIVEVEEVHESDRYLHATAEAAELPDEVVYWPQAIGDERLLRYLTGDQSTPYDEGKAVVIVSGDVRADAVELSYEISADDENARTKTIPAAVARPATPHMAAIFVPSKIVRDLGYPLQPAELIVDPTLHRVTEQERERLDRRLDDDLARTYVERGFQASTRCLPIAAAALLLALASALAPGFGQAANGRQARVLRRTGSGSGAAFRWFCAGRAGLSALLGTVLGAAAGCLAGMLLLWPLTASSSWDDPPRVPFETPWAAVVSVVAGLPLLAAALGALLARERPPVPPSRH